MRVKKGVRGGGIWEQVEAERRVATVGLIK